MGTHPRNSAAAHLFTEDLLDQQFKQGFERERTPQERYILRWLTSGLPLGDVHPCSGMIIEKAYYSGNYRDEYDSYYAKCLDSFKGFTTRVHFFGGRLGEIEIDEASLSACFDRSLMGDESAIKELQECYLGYVSIRPVPGARVGTTRLRPYAAGTVERRFLTQTTTSHICGIPLSIVNAPFMQQDQSVGACATVSLWTAFQLLAEHSAKHCPPTPVITERATRYRIMARPDPALYGLDYWQISEAIRSSGWAPDVLEPYSAQWSGCLIRSYLGSGIPVIAATKLCEPIEQSSEPPVKQETLFSAQELDLESEVDIPELIESGVDGHSMTLVGWEEGSCETVEVPLNKVRARFRSPTKIYLHDDRRGPYLRAELYDQQTHEYKIPTLALVFEDDKHSENWRIRRFYTMHYPMVRVSMAGLYQSSASMIDAIHEEIDNYEDFSPVDIEITIDEGFQYLQSMSKLADAFQLDEISAFKREIVLPVYVGITHVTCNDLPLYTLLWDTTDFSRVIEDDVAYEVEHLLGIVSYQANLGEALDRVMSKVPQDCRPVLLLA